MPWTRRPCASAGLASTSTLASTQEPPPSAARRLSTGESCLHGPHHSAQRSSTTGTWKERSSTSAWKVASVTSTTAEPGAPAGALGLGGGARSEEHTSELQSRQYLVCRPLLEK